MWDLTTGACDQTLTHHAGKVQAVAWNAAEASVLLSGGFDRAACMVRGPWRRTTFICRRWLRSRWSGAASLIVRRRAAGMVLSSNPFARNGGVAVSQWPLERLLLSKHAVSLVQPAGCG